jgi:hypothetical protein
MSILLARSTSNLTANQDEPIDLNEPISSWALNRKVRNALKRNGDSGIIRVKSGNNIFAVTVVKEMFRRPRIIAVDLLTNRNAAPSTSSQMETSRGTRAAIGGLTLGVFHGNSNLKIALEKVHRAEIEQAGVSFCAIVGRMTDPPSEDNWADLKRFINNNKTLSNDFINSALSSSIANQLNGKLLRLVVENDKSDLIKPLAALGIGLCATNTSANDVLKEAIQEGNLEMIEALIRSEVKSDRLANSLDSDPIKTAALGHAEIGEYLKKAKNAQKRVKELVECNRNLNASQLAELKQLIQKGFVNVNARYSNGDTLLHSTIKRGALDTVKQLIQLGANSDLKDGQGNTALALAISLKKNCNNADP